MGCKKCGTNKEQRAASYISRAVQLLTDATADDQKDRTALTEVLQEVLGSLPEPLKNPITSLSREGIQNKSAEFRSMRKAISSVVEFKRGKVTQEELLKAIIDTEAGVEGVDESKR